MQYRITFTRLSAFAGMRGEVMIVTAGPGSAVRMTVATTDGDRKLGSVFLNQRQ